MTKAFLWPKCDIHISKPSAAATVRAAEETSASFRTGRPGGDVSHQPDANPHNGPRQYGQHTVGRHSRSCLDDTVGQASSLMVGAASSEARQFGRHTLGSRGCDLLR